MTLSGQSCRLYESAVMREATGETIRPGGFLLTDRAVNFCSFAPGARLLDVGCGSGATVKHLTTVYKLQVVGVDPSDFLLELGRKQNPELQLLKGIGEALPLPDAALDGVLAECTLSVMQDLERTLGEIYRVLRPGGWFIANDVYARNPAGVRELAQLNVQSCLRGALPKEDLLAQLQAHKFTVVHWEDHTDLLKQLMFKTVMNHGSMAEFWLKSSACTLDPLQAQSAMHKAKMGYYQLIAKKF